LLLGDRLLLQQTNQVFCTAECGGHQNRDLNRRQQILDRSDNCLV